MQLAPTVALFFRLFKARYLLRCSASVNPRTGGRMHGAREQPPHIARFAGLFYSHEQPMDRTDSVALEFSIAGCSVVRGNLAGVPCLTVAGNGKTVLVLLGDPNAPDSRKAADMWGAQLCWCSDRATAHAIAHCLQAGEFDVD